MTCQRIAQRLYDSEVNWRIAVFWDAGFEWDLGDAANGIKASGRADTFAEAEEALAEAALRHFPDSDFAREYRR